MKDMWHYYSLFGLTPGASQSEIKRSYRELVSRWHPDRFGNDPGMQRLGLEKLKEINEAYGAINRWLATGGYRVDGGRSASASTFRETDEKLSSWNLVTGAVWFFSYWPNLLIVLFSLAVGKLAVARFGLSTAAASYCLQLLIIPLLLAVFCNTKWGKNLKLKLAFIATILIFTFLLAIDLQLYQKELQEAVVDSEFGTVGSAESSSTPGHHRSFHPPGKEQPSPDRVREHVSSGPYAPAPPVQPAAPAPIAPVAPAAPLAPSAR